MITMIEHMKELAEILVKNQELVNDISEHEMDSAIKSIFKGVDSNGKKVYCGYNLEHSYFWIRVGPHGIAYNPGNCMWYNYTPRGYTGSI